MDGPAADPLSPVGSVSLADWRENAAAGSSEANCSGCIAFCRDSDRCLTESSEQPE
jgi:hypothetical protein